MLTIILNNDVYLRYTLIAVKSLIHWNLSPTLQMSRGLTYGSMAPKGAYSPLPTDLFFFQSRIYSRNIIQKDPPANLKSETFRDTVL